MSPDPRQCLHSLATFESGDEIEEAGVVSGELVVPGGDATEVFDLVEEAFDQVAIFVDHSVEAAPLGCCRASRDHRNRAGCSNGIHGALAIIAFVGQNPVCAQPFEQWLDLGDVIALSTRENEANRIAQRIGCGMDLGAQPAFGASQRVSFKPIFGLIAFFGAPALC